MIKKILTYSSLLIFITIISCAEDEDIVASPNETHTTSQTPNETETETETTPPPTNTNEVSITDEILNLVNAYREDLKLEPVIKNETAEQLAIDHTVYMIDQGQIGHDNLNERFEILKTEENAQAASENVASSYPDAQSVMTAWIKSDDHRKNLEGNYSKIGIAAIKNSAGKYYYTQLFFR